MSLNGDSQSSNGHRSGFLLSHNIKYPYKGKEQFQELLDLQNGEWALFEVDKETFTDDFLSADTWSSFSTTENLLLARKMTYEHAQAPLHFEKMLDKALGPMGLWNALQSYSRKEVEGETRVKKPDNGWSPARLPRGRSKKWPAAVLDVAALESDICFWLCESQGEVRIVLALTVNRETPEIVIEKWESQDEPRCTQQVTVYRDNDRVHVRSALIIEFNKLFLRDVAIPREKDIQFPEAKLEALAEAIWQWQEFPA